MQNIRPISELRNTTAIDDICHEINEPVFITKNGYNDLVIMSNEVYERKIQNTTSKYNSKRNESNYNDIKIQNYNDQSYGFIRVAAATFSVKISDVDSNVQSMIDLIKYCNHKEAKIVVFPELSISGYTCGDLFLETTLQKAVLNGIKTILEETKKIDSLIFFGAPLVFQNKYYNTAIICHKGEILGVVPKSNIPNYSEFYEGRYFSKAPEENKTITINGKQVPFGKKLLFINTLYPDEIVGAEICEDLWIPDSPSLHHALAGATIIANLSASNEVIGKEEYRLSLVNSQSAKTMTAYIYSSCAASESTTDVLFSGANIISEYGSCLKKSPLFNPDVIMTEIDVNKLLNERIKMNSFNEYQDDGYQFIPFASNITLPQELIRKFKRNPFIPSDEKARLSRYNKILFMQALGLKKRIEASGVKNLVLGISGGLDSALAMLVANRAIKELDMDPKSLTCITMPCFGTSERTLRNAINLTNGFGNDLKNIDITESVKLHLKTIGHDEAKSDIAYENAQARERTQVLMDYANQINGLVVGTGDLSEIALGWSTYNGDHMSMYAVNASIPKTLVRDMIRTLAYQYPLVKETLLDILDTPVSPELIPAKNGQITQITEDIVGPYELHDFFLYYFIRYNFSIKKIYYISKIAFDGVYDNETIKKWLKFFVKRFFTQQFKRSCMPDGVKVGTVALSPRGDWRMPSDATYKSFLKELEEI